MHLELFRHRLTYWHRDEFWTQGMRRWFSWQDYPLNIHITSQSTMSLTYWCPVSQVCWEPEAKEQMSLNWKQNVCMCCSTVTCVCVFAEAAVAVGLLITTNTTAYLCSLFSVRLKNKVGTRLLRLAMLTPTQWEVQVHLHKVVDLYFAYFTYVDIFRTFFYVFYLLPLYKYTV